MKTYHPDGTPGGLCLEVLTGEATTITINGQVAEITVGGTKQDRAGLIIRAPREFRIDRKNWKGRK